jgi:hypothetical protein
MRFSGYSPIIPVINEDEEIVFLQIKGHAPINLLGLIFVSHGFELRFFFYNGKQTPFVGDRTLDVYHGRRQEVPLSHKAWIASSFDVARY